jgi:sugar (pentulose or hexulose) kinase
LPRIVDQYEPVGSLSASLMVESGIEQAPLIFPTSDDQQAGLVGGGAVDAGQLAIILGNSAVVNSSSAQLPATDKLDTMRLNWGPYLWMRCYNNGAQFLDRVVGKQPDWGMLEEQAMAVAPGVGGAMVLPFVQPEPSLGVMEKRFGWHPSPRRKPGEKFRAALEAIAYLIALGVRQHEQAGQVVSRVSVSGGIARSRLMCEILASVLGKPLHRLQSQEGPALGAAVTALAGLETNLRRKQQDNDPFDVADAVAQMVKFRDVVQPNAAWSAVYAKELRLFSGLMKK